ncbi:MAG: hypothetical protein J1E83_10460 [Lachnospiraceae bacterium]|nr:hypothetical protein [Lachnospiraceae bacterium]
MGKYQNPIPNVENDAKIENVKNVEFADDYSECKVVYFAFLDILGFKKAFDDNRQKNDSEFAEKFRDVFNYFFELMNASNFMKDNDSYAGQTSDSLYFYTTRSDMLLEFLHVFSHFNLYAMSKNVFFRGGVAKGSLFIKEKYQFYGESVIYAYLLENVIARNPVIYIDENTYNELKEYSGIDALIKEKGERYYIRPFAGLSVEMKMYLNDYSTINIREISLDVIQNNIEYNKRLFEYDAKNFEKYVFLINELSER